MNLSELGMQKKSIGEYIHRELRREQEETSTTEEAKSRRVVNQVIDLVQKRTTEEHKIPCTASRWHRLNTKICGMD